MKESAVYIFNVSESPRLPSVYVLCGVCAPGEKTVSIIETKCSLRGLN